MLRTISLLAIESFSYRWVVVQPPGHTTAENSQYGREASPQTSSRQRDSAVPIRRDFPARNRTTPGNRAASAGVTVSQPSIWQANAWAMVTETHRSPYGPVCPSSPNLRPSCQDSNRVLRFVTKDSERNSVLFNLKAITIQCDFCSVARRPNSWAFILLYIMDDISEPFILPVFYLHKKGPVVSNLLQASFFPSGVGCDPPEQCRQYYLPLLCSLLESLQQFRRKD
uniref:Uncharacterized protein n=1 Tax=Glossina pallidipes TaxID=7398 RepID=A0A1A9ZGD4_GLOPL